MGTVTVRFTGGPADGAVHELPARADGRPPDRWVLSRHPAAPGDHLYENAGRDERGGWQMRFVRSDPLRVSE